jgi:hypothetical protein
MRIADPRQSQSHRPRRAERKLAGAMLATTALLLGGCGEPGEEDSSQPEPKVTEVTSDDGLLVLSIPAGALPSGVKAGDVRIQALPPDTAVLTAGEQSWPMIGWRLEPDGLELSKPATATVTFENVGEPGILMALHRGAAGDDLLELKVDIDLPAQAPPSTPGSVRPMFPRSWSTRTAPPATRSRST